MARYVSNAERGAANLVALVLSYRNKHKQIDKSIETLAQRLDEKIIQLKNEILGGASSAFDTLAELQQIIEQNQEGIRVLESLAAGHVRFDRIQNLNANEKAIGRQNLDAVSKAELEAAVGSIIPMTPTLSVSKTGNVTTLTTQDAKGTTTAQIKDGERGPHYTPILDDDGNLSWTNDAGLVNPVSKNIKGPRGLQGVQGVPGIQGEKGDPGAGLIIHGEYETYEELVAAHPVGEEGDAYLVDGDVWYWSAENNQWKNGGPLRGPQGIQGPRGYHYTPSVDSNGTLSWTNDGGLVNPDEVNVRGPRGFHFTPSVNSNGDLSWSNDGSLTNPTTKNIRGPRGFTFTPNLTSDGILSFTNDGGLTNPAAVDLTGPQGIQGERGYHFTPSVSNDGTLSWTNNGGLTNPSSKNIRGPQGFTFTPSLASDGTLSFTNNGGLSNPNPVNLTGPRGFTFTPSVDGKGNISWTNNGGLTNPATQNIRGYHFTPTVDGKGNLSWTNNGGLDNPATQNIRGYHYTPTVDDNGNISWTNNGDLDNPATKNIRGPQGFTFTPSMASDGTLSWSNNGGLANPSPQNLTGPRGFSVRDALLTEEFTAEEFWMYTDSSLQLWWKVSNASDFVAGDVACIHKAIEIDGYAQPYQITCFGVVTGTRSNEIRVSIFARVRDGVNGTNGEKGDAFEYDDFTPDQLEALKGPKGDTGPGMKSINVGSKNSSFFNVEAGKHVMIGVEEQPVVLYPGDMLCAYGTMADQENNFAILFGEVSTYTFDNAGNWQIGLYVRGQFRALRGQKGDTGSTGATGPRGYTFTPSVSSAGVLSWKNDGNLTNPSNVNLKGADGIDGKDGVTFTPSITNGVLSWTNDGNLANPANVTVEGKDGKNGATFTPSVSSAGVLSWTNDGGLTNPSTVNIKGPKGDTGPAGGVTSVNGMTGAVVIDVGSGGGGSGDGIPRTGDRGVLAGYERFAHGATLSSPEDILIPVTVNNSSNDVSFCSYGDIVVENGSSSGYCKAMFGIGSADSEFSTWTKVVFFMGASSITLDSRWMWVDNVTPELGMAGVLVLHWNTDFGIARLIDVDGDGFGNLFGVIAEEEGLA